MISQFNLGTVQRLAGKQGCGRHVGRAKRAAQVRAERPLPSATPSQARSELLYHCIPKPIAVAIDGHEPIQRSPAFGLTAARSGGFPSAPIEALTRRGLSLACTPSKAAGGEGQRAMAQAQIVITGVSHLYRPPSGRPGLPPEDSS